MKRGAIKLHTNEMLRSYSLEQLEKRTTIKLKFGQILAMKNLAIKYGFEELAEVLRKKEKEVVPTIPNPEKAKPDQFGNY